MNNRSHWAMASTSIQRGQDDEEAEEGEEVEEIQHLEAEVGAGFSWGYRKPWELYWKLPWGS